MKKFYLALTVMALSQLAALGTQDGSAIYTLGVGSVLIFGAVTFRYTPARAYKPLLGAMVLFALYVGARFDATLAKSVIGSVILILDISAIYAVHARKI